MTAEIATDHSGSPPPASATALRPVRVWPAVAMLVPFWIFEFSIYTADLAMFPRFMTRVLVYGALVLLFLGWWLSNPTVAWRDRLLTVLVLITATVLASFIMHPTVRGPALVMVGFPIIFTAWTAWLLVARALPRAQVRSGLIAATLLVLGYFALIRWDGLDGAQRSAMNWRWTPTPEEIFLASAKEHPAPAGETPPSRQPEAWMVQPGDRPDFQSERRVSLVATEDSTHSAPDSAPSLLWRRRVGPGWSSMILVDGHVVTQEQRGAAEAVVAYDLETGSEQWAHVEEGRFEEALSGTGPRGTPTFHGGRIFAVGARGRLVCLDAATGKRRWSREVVHETQAAMPQWGVSVSPLVLDDLVIVFAGGQEGNSLVAYRADTGEPAWQQAGGGMSYSSPQLLTLAGRQQVLMHDDLGLHAVDPASGELLWELNTENGGGSIPMIQPHAIGNDEILTAWGDGLARLAVRREGDKWTTETRWTTKQLKPGFNDVVVESGSVYGLDDGILCCLDLATGHRRWKRGRYGHGQVLLLAARRRLLVMAEAGEVILVQANPERHEELGRFPALRDKTWNHPILAQSRLLVRNGAEMACFRWAIPANEMDQ